MRLSKWLSILLCVCLISTMLALAEEPDVGTDAPADVPADTETEETIVLDGTDEQGEIPQEEVGELLGDDIELSYDEGEEELASEETTSDEADAERTLSGEEQSAEAREGLAYAYAGVTADMAPMYFDEDGVEALAKLAKGETLLVTGEADGMAAVAVNLSGRIMEGFVKASQLRTLTAEEIDAYVLSVADGVALYQDDINWPIGPLSAKSKTDGLEVMASNYDDLSNDTVFVMNGKKIKASDVESQGLHNCWKWANKIYKKAWGTTFDSSFTGSSGKDLNLLRNLSDNERKLTPENLKYFVRNSVPGATLRVTNCVSSCSGFKTDSCGKHSYLHSLIIAEIREDGLVTMDDQNKVHTRFYTWEGFCKAWAKWDHVKYIKWPNAKALPSLNSVDGYSVGDISTTYRARATAKSGAAVYSLPENGKVVDTIIYPQTFKATRMTVKNYGGCTWVHGQSANGVTGWLPVNDLVADVNSTIKVTGVSLSQTKVALLKGNTATLTATIAPVDATNTQVTWSSSDTGVATVSNGVVTGTGNGTATITVTTKDGGKTATCTVAVAAVDVSKVLSKQGSNGTVNLQPGQQLLLTAKFATKKGWKVKGYSSSKKKVASVTSAGIVTAKAAGKATITATTKNGKKATVKVVVADPTVPTKVVLSKKGTVKLKKGKTLKLYAKVTPETATTTLTWASSKSSVATVDNDGNVTALKKGKCKIGVKTSNGKYATVKITVY